MLKRQRGGGMQAFRAPRSGERRDGCGSGDGQTTDGMRAVVGRRLVRPLGCRVIVVTECQSSGVVHLGQVMNSTKLSQTGENSPVS